MENQTYVPVSPSGRPHDPATYVAAGGMIKRISWGAIFAGMVIALALQALLSMLGAGVGLSTIDPSTVGESPSVGAFGVGAGIWLLGASLIALFFGGWVAGRASGVFRPVDGALHGVLTWAIAVLGMFYLLGTAAGSLISGATGLLGTAASATASGVAAAAPKVGEVAGGELSPAGVSWDSIKRDALQLLSQTGKPVLQPNAIQQQAKDAVAEVKGTAANTAMSDQDLTALIDRLLSRGRNVVSQADRDAVINVLIARTGMSREDAARRVQGWENAADQARTKAAQAADEAQKKAREVADATAKGVSRAMLWGFLALAIGGLAAALGGSLGQRGMPMYIEDARA